MGTWHEDMMRSSDSFRECHENRGRSEPVENIVVEDYISITHQSNNYYWCVYSFNANLTVGKSYHVSLNDVEYSTVCILDEQKPTLWYESDDCSINIKFNTTNSKFIIDYYPKENIGSNPTVYLKIAETEPYVPSVFVVTMIQTMGETSPNYELKTKYKHILNRLNMGDVPILRIVDTDNNFIDCLFSTKYLEPSGTISLDFYNVNKEKRVTITDMTVMVI